ncbi:MAG TPA: SGNH/GDSL hydrolase family protein [Alphaproteobacteria bacterium]|nr:SGNH/GDSL hydrolase family protein [Alphaproteobacteria bacterium]
MKERPNFKNILVLGDSISDGFYDAEGMGWIGRLEQLLHTETPLAWGFQNFSVSGDRTVDALYRLSGFLTRKSTDYLFIHVGVNDLYRYGNENAPISMVPELRHHFWDCLFRLAKPFTKKIFVFSLLPVNEKLNGTSKDNFGTPLFNFNSDIEEYNEQIKRWAIDNDAVFINLYDRFKEFGAEDILFDDSHPNIDGHKLLAQWTYEELKDKI